MAKVNTSSGVASFAVLGQVLRPTAVVHVGAGYGRGWLHQWRNWGVSTAWLIDADASKLGWVNKLSGGGSLDGSTDNLTTAPSVESTVYHAVPAVVGQESGEGVFFQANNPEENSLVSPDNLRRVWANLRAVSKQSLPIKTLDELVTVPAGAWLVVDCLPALDVLKGAQQLLDNTQVVVARVLLDGKVGGDSVVTDAGTGSVDSASAKPVIDFLAGLGFTVVDEVLGHHPGVGHLVFARSYSVVGRKELVSSIEQEKLAKDKVVAELNQKVQAATAERDTATQDKAAVLKQKDDLQKKLGEVQSQFTSQLLAAKEEVANAGKQRDELNQQLAGVKKQLETERQAQLDQAKQIEQVKHTQAELVQQKDEAVKKLGEVQAKLAEQSKEKEATAAQRDAVAKEKAALVAEKDALTKQLDDQKKAVVERQAKLDELTKSLQAEAQKVNDLSAKLETTSAEKTAAEQEKAAVAKQKEDLAKKLADTEQQFATATQEKANAVKQRDELTQQLSSLKEQSEKAKQAQQGLVQQRDEAVKRLGEVEARLAAVSKEKEAVVAQRDALAGEKAALASERDAVTEHRDSLVQEKDTLAQQNQALAAEKTALVADRDRLAGEKTAVADQLEEQKKAVTERQAKIDELTKSLQAETQKVKDLSGKVEAVTAEKTELAQQKQSLEKTLKDKDGLIAEKTKAESEAQTSVDTLRQEIEKLKADLSVAQKTALAAGSLEKRLEELFSEQKTYIQQTTSALGQHVTRMSQQQRDQSALSHYMQSGQWLVDTSLSPTYAKALVQLRDNRQYDAMVVFGSSASVEFLSQVVMAPRPGLPRLSNDRLTGQELSETVNRVSDRDLPQSILALEHQREQCDVLIQKLKSKGLDQCVEVLHAPWIEASFQGKSALFYAADRPLSRLYQWLKDDARVLVVLGDTLPAAGHSREVALSVLLQHLPTQVLDVVLEPTDSPLDTNLVENWEALTEGRQLRSERLKVATALALRVNE